MKKFRFFNTAHRSPLTIFLAFCNLLLLLNVLLSCQRETTDQAEARPTTTAAVTERGTCGLGYCEFTITATTDTVFIEICGDILPSGAGCNFGCNTLGNDRYYSTEVLPGFPITICVSNAGSVCIRNTATATDTADLEVNFENSAIPLNISLAPNAVRCFHTNSTCSQTLTLCQ